MKIKVAIVEDNFLLAQSIEEKLRLFPEDLEFKYRASNGNDILRQLRDDHSIDTILMDIEMPAMDGIEATGIITETYPQIKIIMLTVFDDDEKIFRSIQAGAMGYILKDENPLTLLESIKMIMNGGAPMSPTIAAKSLSLLKDPGRIQRTSHIDFGLSHREIIVLEHISHGLGHKEIADNLFISPSTVRKHIENIYRKLQVNNKIRAIKKASKHGLI